MDTLRYHQTWQWKIPKKKTLVNVYIAIENGSVEIVGIYPAT